MQYGNLETKEQVASDLAKYNQMTDAEKTAFKAKMKKFSNLAKLG
jgi:hypothetical protein